MEDWELDYDDEPEAWRELDVDGMEALDRSLRCGICGELLTSPVAPKCGHMFCSVCIRRSLAAFNECCPNCRGAASSESLQPCHSLCAVADAFKQARQSVLKACKERMELKKRQTKGGGEEREEKGEPAGHEVDVDLREGSEEVGASPEKGPSYQGRVEGKGGSPLSLSLHSSSLAVKVCEHEASLYSARRSLPHLQHAHTQGVAEFARARLP